MNSGIIGSGMLGSAAMLANPSWQVITLVIAGMGAVGWFIKHQQSEIKRLTKRLDEAKDRSDGREAQIEGLRKEIFNLRKEIADERSRADH